MVPLRSSRRHDTRPIAQIGRRRTALAVDAGGGAGRCHSTPESVVASGGIGTWTSSRRRCTVPGGRGGAMNGSETTDAVLEAAIQGRLMIHPADLPGKAQTPQPIARQSESLEDPGWRATNAKPLPSATFPFARPLSALPRARGSSDPLPLKVDPNMHAAATNHMVAGRGTSAWHKRNDRLRSPPVHGALEAFEKVSAK